MTDYFLGNAIAGMTPNFLVTYDEADAAAEGAAQAILTVCEADLKKLEYFFATNFQVGGNNDYATWVHVANAGGGGSNFGWGGDESSIINILGTKPAPNDAEYARFVFVAELAEILMDFTGYGWDRRASHGEALSIFLATELHGAAYYATNSGPRVNEWLALNPRPDWIRASEDSDTNRVSYGCGLLFLNWLRYQLGFPVRDIVTRPGAWTLANVHAALTGRTDGWTAFTDLLQRHLPPGSAGSVARDNIFPLYDEKSRRVSLSETAQVITSTRREPSHFVTLDPGFACPARDYRYWLVEQVEEIDVRAVCRGFANARVDWTINGVVLAGGRGATSDSVQVPGETVLRLPDGHETKDPSAFIDLQYLIGGGWNRSTLRVRNLGKTGESALDIKATAYESAVADPGVVATEHAAIAGLVVEIEDAWYDDRRRCNPYFQDLDRSIIELAERIFVLLHTPDPYPGWSLGRIVAAATAVQDEARQAADSIGSRADRILAELFESPPDGVGSSHDRAVEGSPLVLVRDLGADRDRRSSPSPWGRKPDADRSTDVRVRPRRGPESRRLPRARGGRER